MVPNAPTIFLLLFLLVACTGDITDMGVKLAEARRCYSRSHYFRGLCFRDSNCRHLCHHEHFSDGHCRGFRHRCICSRPC
ncbi:Defensin-like protein 5 [Zostera marina]|uniref:Defensin-like protein 5 n=1 Tax=Zostera marina TaxID=29655 RepID=A0A0K9NHU7_ZOSMR|nr:Defensin-like protein 5 [Zostera marina]